MRRLVEVIANPHATASLFEILSSEMFVLSADDFIELSTLFDEGKRMFRRRGDRCRIRRCVCVWNRAKRAFYAPGSCRRRGEESFPGVVGTMPVSRIMAKAVEESGWLSRLESLGAEGQSVAGNVMKADPYRRVV